MLPFPWIPISELLRFAYITLPKCRAQLNSNNMEPLSINSRKKEILLEDTNERLLITRSDGGDKTEKEL
jgi:hypothetical protein